MTVISVGRAGQEIGNYNLDGVKEGLASGFFFPDDWGWYEGLTEWLPLPAIVERLQMPPPPPVALPISPARAAIHVAALPPAPAPTKLVAAPTIKRKLKPNKGEVIYVLKAPKPKKKSKRAAPAPKPSWESDPATDKQIAFLETLGAGTLPKSMTKGEAHDRIDALLGNSRGQAHTFLSPKQLACLHYYGFDVSKLNYDEAKALLDRVHDSPESFDVPEPWETAKYRLYPRLYPDPNPKRKMGCLAVCLLLFLAIVGVAYLSSSFK
jgi:hypothetical protein